MRLFLFFFTLLVTGIMTSQELPPIIKYTTDEYEGDNQNWMISQNENGFIYVANNNGLLEFNGASWKRYDSPNNTIVRSVKVIGDRIYTGCTSEFGYWKKDRFGMLNYNSVLSSETSELLKNQQVWDIFEYEDLVIFRTSRTLFFYDTQTQDYKTLASKNLIYKIFKLNKTIYYHVANEGIYTMESGQPRLLFPNSTFNSDRVISIDQDKLGLLLTTRSSGFFRSINGTLENWNVNSAKSLAGINIFSSIQLKDGSIILGTISNGLIHLEPNGDLKYHITQKNGLGNNTVLSMFEDRDNNVWVGLDNGINCINVTSPFRQFTDFEGILGTIYSSVVFDNKLYLGTNQGLFFKELEEDNSTFKFVEGTAGQVLSLYIYEDKDLLCGHHLGTFLIKNDVSIQIDNSLGTWGFQSIMGKPNQLIKGNYDGLYIIEKIGKDWSLRNKIEGFNISSRYFHLSADNFLWISHENRGLFQLQLDDDLTKVISNKIIDLPRSKNSSLLYDGNNILFSTKQGIYKTNETQSEFKIDSTLSSIYDKYNYISGKLEQDENGNLWMFSKENISVISRDNITNSTKILNIPIPAKMRKGAKGYENVSHLKNNNYLLGNSEGYITVDLSNLHFEKDYEVSINSIELENFKGKTIKIDHFEPITIENSHRTIEFEFSVPEYSKYVEVRYQYKLIGSKHNWSNWANKSSVKFENLPFGDYRFEVRAQVGNQLSKNVSNYEFTIARPWYISNIMIVAYISLLIIIILITHRAYKVYYHKKLEREQLENQQMIMHFKNEKLNLEIENKNRELAISTMSIIKKNEVLNKIKKELKHNEIKTADNAIDLIDRNLNTTKDWKFFKQAFNNVDNEFLDKIKMAHPSLTPNDLKFCAYLRLNLSSKEIAPLLNISIKSVETKRYRLRKRLKLDHNESLVNYILKF